MTTVIRAAGAADFLALVPRLLGFVPTRSIVLVPFAGNRTLGALRLDLPELTDADEIDGVASTFIGLVCKVAHADAVAAIVFTDGRVAEAGRLPHEPLVTAILARADLCGLRVSEALCLAVDAWGSYLDGDLPPTGRPLGDIPTDDDAFADMPLAGGDQAAGAALPTVNLAEKERVARSLRLLEDEMSGGEPSPEHFARLFDGHASRSAPTPEIAAFLAAEALGDPTALFEEALGWDPDDVWPAEEAAVVWCLARPALRDVALVQWSANIGRGDEALDAQLAWADGAPYPPELATAMWGEGPRPDPERLARALSLCRRIAAVAPRAVRPGPLSACAWLAWALGQSTHAAHYARAALEIEPAHGMAGIVLTYVSNAYLPEWAFERPAPPTVPVTRLVDSAGVERGRRPADRRRPQQRRAT